MPRPRVLFAALAIAALALPATAGTINLRWNACWGDGGIMNKVFACNTNTGTNFLHASFIPALGVPQVTGLDAVIDVAVAGGSLPDWWAFRAAGSCRANSLGVATAAPTTAVACSDWSSGLSLGLITAYLLAPFGPGSARILVSTTLGSAPPIDVPAGQESYAFSLRIDNQKTVGSGACAGCSLGACLALKIVRLNVAAPGNSVSLSSGSNSADNDDRLVTWQGGAGVIVSGPDYLNCPLATPTRGSTWSGLKSLYR